MIVNGEQDRERKREREREREKERERKKEGGEGEKIRVEQCDSESYDERYSTGGLLSRKKSFRLTLG